MYGLVRDESNIAWLEVSAMSNYRNHDFKEAIESFDRMFEGFCRIYWYNSIKGFYYY